MTRVRFSKGDWTFDLKGPWANFVHDSQLSGQAFDGFKRSKRFKDFVEVRAPLALADLWHDRADMAVIMDAHREVILDYISVFPPKPGSQQDKYVTTYLKLIDKCSDPYFYLAVVGSMSEEVYCLQRPGLTPAEFDHYTKGAFSLGGLYVLRPSFILRHLLPRSFPTH